MVYFLVVELSDEKGQIYRVHKEYKQMNATTAIHVKSLRIFQMKT